MQTYEWYELVEGGNIEQGDILHGCPVFRPPDDLPLVDLNADTPPDVVFNWNERDVIVMTQSCDLARDHPKVEEVLLCGVWPCDEITRGHLASEKGKEDCRRGHLPGYHMLAKCDFPRFERGAAVVDFRRVYSLPLSHLRSRAQEAGQRLRLLPPYKEHLSQAFARYFMRVGLPEDIPPFRTT